MKKIKKIRDNHLSSQKNVRSFFKNVASFPTKRSVVFKQISAPPPPIPLQKGDRYAASMERRKEKLMPAPNGISPAGGGMGGGDYCSRFLFLTLATMPRSIIIALATPSMVAATVLMLCSTSSFEKRITLKPAFSKAACRIWSFF